MRKIPGYLLESFLKEKTLSHTSECQTYIMVGDFIKYPVYFLVPENIKSNKWGVWARDPRCPKEKPGYMTLDLAAKLEIVKTELREDLPAIRKLTSISKNIVRNLTLIGKVS